MPKGRNSKTRQTWQRKRNTQRAYQRAHAAKRANSVRSKPGGPAPVRKQSGGYINRRSNQWRSATRAAINRSK